MGVDIKTSVLEITDKDNMKNAIKGKKNFLFIKLEHKEKIRGMILFKNISVDQLMVVASLLID